MRIKTNSINELKAIIANDYGIFLSEEQAIDFGTAMLRLTRVGIVALARANECRSHENLSVRNNQRQRGSQRVPEITKPAEKRGALLPPETSADADKLYPGSPGREEGIS